MATISSEKARAFAEAWIAAWNAHDLEAILAHYAEEVELTSPVAAQLLGVADGRVVGLARLRTYFARGLEAFPELRFELVNVLAGAGSVVLYYKNQRGTQSAEYMEIAANGKVMRVVAHYSV
jgi:steroid delta-isomerase-like uncharacterized protein